MKHLLITTIAAVLFANSVCAELITAKIPRKLLISHKLKINDHTFAVYEKKADSSSDIILFVHGRTISSLPNFNLQIESKSNSIEFSGFEKNVQVNFGENRTTKKVHVPFEAT